MEFNLREKGKTDTLKEMQQIADFTNIHYIRQKEPLGLEYAVLCAEHFIGDEPFAVLLGDDIMVSETPALRQLMDVYDVYGTEVVGVQSVLPEDVSKYGIINTSGSQGHVYEVNDLVEKPSPEEAPSEIAVMGRYVLNSSIFSVLKTIGRGAGNEIQLTDALREVCRNEPIHARLLEGNRYDIGDKLGCFKASTEIGLMRPEMRSQLLAYLEDVIKQATKEMLR